jgi:hypothetical protein
MIRLMQVNVGSAQPTLIRANDGHDDEIADVQLLAYRPADFPFAV